jgi:hypothetical protein
MKMISMTFGATLIVAFSAFAQDKSNQHTEHQSAAMHHDMSQVGFMQGAMHHTIAKGVALESKIDMAQHSITLRVGPMTLPAHTGHMKMPQPADVVWTIPIDGWLLSYTPQLVDGGGTSVPGRVLHHVAFWNTNRADFLCPNKEEHIYGAGSEMNTWPQVPGYGYRVQKGDNIRIETMVHNPTDVSYDHVYLEVAMAYQELSAAGADKSAAMKSFYPAWMDVTSCGNSSYDLKPGKNENSGEVTLKYAGVLLGVGGHMHDYAKRIVLQDDTRHEQVAALDAQLDEQGHLQSIPVKTFFQQGGYSFAAGDVLRISATYDNPTGKILHDGAMGIVVGYYVPADDALVAKLRRTPRNPANAMAHDMPGMTRDR